jgi:hypothetical protein
MQLPEFTAQVTDQLRAAAALGDDRTQQIAATLSGAADAAVRLAVLSAVSAAADEINAALAEADLAGAPSARVALDGDDLRVSVALATPAEPPGRTDDGEATARISLRLSDALKNDIDQAAAQDNVSVNTWLVRAAGSALARAKGSAGWDADRPPGHGAHRITGWITG